jgi:hypothetical protein
MIPKLRKPITVFAAAFIAMSIQIAASGQVVPAAPAIVGLPKPLVIVRTEGDTTERSIKVDPGVNLSLCVSEGSLKVNGWGRSEVRVFVSGGSKFGFKIQQKSPKTGDPVWIMVAAESDGKNKYGSGSDCISGDEIEIDAPASAVLNLKGQEITTTVDGIRRVSIKNVGGDISVRNISDGITAATYRGDMTVEQSMGAMVLENTSGNILVFDAGPSEIGDIFKAKTTSGAISVQKIEHRQIEVNSISGTVAYNGDILSGGSYSLGTSNGSIKLSIPSATSCTINASYGGAFSSELAFKLVTENITPGPIKLVVATIGGGGDASLRLTTNLGSISIKKQP